MEMITCRLQWRRAWILNRRRRWLIWMRIFCSRRCRRASGRSAWRQSWRSRSGTTPSCRRCSGSLKSHKKEQKHEHGNDYVFMFWNALLRTNSTRQDLIRLMVRLICGKYVIEQSWLAYCQTFYFTLRDKGFMLGLKNPFKLPIVLLPMLALTPHTLIKVWIELIRTPWSPCRYRLFGLFFEFLTFVLHV